MVQPSYRFACIAIVSAQKGSAASGLTASTAWVHGRWSRTLAFVDFSGNRQYITSGNLLENPKAHLFLIDYRQRKRVKIWGEARMVEADDAWLSRLMPEGYKARPEQVLLFNVAAWDANCPQHIPLRLEAADVQAALAHQQAHKK